MSFSSTKILYCGLLDLINKSDRTKNMPAIMNLKVAIAIGVILLSRTHFTTTNELPQNKIKKIIKAKLIGLIAFDDMKRITEIRLEKDSVH